MSNLLKGWSNAPPGFKRTGRPAFSGPSFLRHRFTANESHLLQPWNNGPLSFFLMCPLVDKYCLYDTRTINSIPPTGPVRVINFRDSYALYALPLRRAKAWAAEPFAKIFWDTLVPCERTAANYQKSFLAYRKLAGTYGDLLLSFKDCLPFRSR